MSTCQPVSSKMTVALEVVVESGADATAWSCAQCHEELDVHQPDPENPTRLLGICPGCQGWYIRDEIQDAEDSILIHLPEPSQLQRVIQSEDALGVPHLLEAADRLGA